MTSQATWTSSSTSVATINSAGLRSGAAAGTTTITAASAGVTGMTTLTVQSAPLTITTTSLPNGSDKRRLLGDAGRKWRRASISLDACSGIVAYGLNAQCEQRSDHRHADIAGTYNFTAQVSDSSNPVQSTTKPLSITVTAAPSTVTIWPSSTVPAVVDGGPDSAVRARRQIPLGRSPEQFAGFDSTKRAANTGPHVASLWSSAGTTLATATFTGETASGWQQVNFTTPVAISANTVYVASYHTTTGHYSINANYFASTGADNAPLHALATGVSGGNGVYRYGASNVFPNQTWNASNYWVDVVFQPN